MPSVRCLCLPGHTAEAVVAMTLALGPSGQDHYVRPQTMCGSQYLCVLSRAVVTCCPCLLPSTWRPQHPQPRTHAEVMARYRSRPAVSQI